MKKVITLMFLVLLCQIARAQEVEECRKIVDLTIEAITEKSTAKLTKYLAPDFSIAGQKGEVAKMVLNQLLSQLGESVKSYEETDQNKLEEELVLKYNIVYEKLGLKETTFIFNKNNLLKELNLFKMEVKKMPNESNVLKSAEKVIEIPFQMADKLILVDVLLNGTKRKFILDTGAPKVILNSGHIPQDSSVKTISSSRGVSGNISGMNIEKVKSLDFNGIQLINEEVITIDLSHLEKELDVEFYGLIGYDLIKDYDIIFDYETQQLTLVAADTYEEYKRANLKNNQLAIIPFELQGHLPIITATINDQMLNLGIDCGAESNLIDDDLFQTVKKATCNISSDELLGADNNSKEVKTGNIKKMKIGPKIFKKTSTSFSDISHLNKGYKLNLDGLIGYPILSKQKTLISFSRKEIIFIE